MCVFVIHVLRIRGLTHPVLPSSFADYSIIVVVVVVVIVVRELTRILSYAICTKSLSERVILFAIIV